MESLQDSAIRWRAVIAHQCCIFALVSVVGFIGYDFQVLENFPRFFAVGLNA
jgi:hypothetical protein